MLWFTLGLILGYLGGADYLHLSRVIDLAYTLFPIIWF